jgi:hypothetical protein
LQNYFHDQIEQYWFKDEQRRATSIQSTVQSDSLIARSQHSESFATQSALLGPWKMSRLSLQIGPKRTLNKFAVTNRFYEHTGPHRVSPFSDAVRVEGSKKKKALRAMARRYRNGTRLDILSTSPRFSLAKGSFGKRLRAAIGEGFLGSTPSHLSIRARGGQ